MYIGMSDTFIEVAYITGPSHNTLFLELTDEEGFDFPRIEKLPPHDKRITAALDEQEIVRAVNEGVAHVNQLLRTSYIPKYIKYISDDTPRYIIYSVVAHHATVFHHKLQLQTQNRIQQQVFEIIMIEPVNKNHTRIKGRAWAHVRQNDVVFGVEEDGTMTEFVVTALFTYGHKVDELPEIYTGELILEHEETQEIPRSGFLYR